MHLIAEESLFRADKETFTLDKKIDVLFIHPVVHRKGQLLHVIMPVGFFSLANTLKKNGFKTKIIHVGVEEVLNQKYSLADAISEHNPDIVCTDIHWYVHIYEALQVAKLAKECCGSFTVLGGYTASFFNEELLENFPYVDAVIKGDGEIPLLKLVKEFYASKEYSMVPNLTYRSEHKIIKNLQTYGNHRSEDTAPIDLSILDHWDVYLRINLWGKDDVPIYALFDPNFKSSLDLMVYRGCTFQCSYCGGGKRSQADIFGRSGVIFKDLKQLMDDCHALDRQGVQEIRAAYVPVPGADTFYLSWFRELQKAGLRFDCTFSFWQPPSRAFMNEFKNTFGSKRVEMSPDSGSEKIRKKYKNCFYTNENLYEHLRLAKECDVVTDLYFIFGFPGDSKNDYDFTLEMSKDLVRNGLINKATTFALNIEPSSSFHLFPEKYRIKLFRKSVMDFYNWGKEVSTDKKLTHYLGFERDDVSEKDILNFAKHFNKEMSQFQNAG